MNLTPWELAIAQGEELYPWQVRALESFGRGYPTALVTCNGAGKTTRVASRAVDWFFKKYPRGWLVATSSSFNQLQNQTWAALERSLPGGYEVRRAGSGPCTLKSPGGGEGIGFSTRDAGRAEGWHPKISPEIDPVMLLIDEGKSVPDAIWFAFDRCTIAYSLIISSPGAPFGRFFDCFHKLRKYYATFKVTSMDCPHIPDWKRERDREVMPEDKFRSAHLAEFMDAGEAVVMSPEALQAALRLAPGANTRGPKFAFFDFARGGDENVFAFRSGNKISVEDAWRDRDTVQAVRRFIRKAQDLGLSGSQCWGDADGLGGPMVDLFKDEGFPINEFHGGGRANDSENYENLISEVWIQGARRIQRGDFHFSVPDPVLHEQLTTRLFQWSKRGKKKVESKEDMRKRGLPSPDRADGWLGVAMADTFGSTVMTGDAAESAAVGSSDFDSGIVEGF